MDRASLILVLLRLLWPLHTDILQRDKVLLWQLLPLSEGETVRQLLGDTCNTHATKYQVDESFQTFGINDYKCSMMGRRVWACHVCSSTYSLFICPSGEGGPGAFIFFHQRIYWHKYSAPQIKCWSTSDLTSFRTCSFPRQQWDYFFSVPLTKTFKKNNLKQQQQNMSTILASQFVVKF